MKKMEDHNFKNVIIFILFIFLLFFISNDKKFNKIFQKNIMKILFLVTLVYMSYLKINICIILGVFFLFILLNTDIGKKLQKNKYMKRIIKICSPYVTPIEDFIYSFTEISDDDSSVGSNQSGRKKVRFEDEDDDEKSDFENMDYENVDDLLFEDEKDEKIGKKEKIGKEKSNINYDILDEIRNDMNIEIPLEKSKIQEETLLEKSDYEVEEENSEEPDAILDKSEVRELYRELASVKEQLHQIDE